MARKDVTDRMVVDAYNWGRELGIRPLAFLKQTTGEPEKVCWRAMERAYDHGLIECGVSLDSGWITEKGMELIKREKPNANARNTETETVVRGSANPWL
jgi:hypothetical protein